jgi:hypothetical protein
VDLYVSNPDLRLYSVDGLQLLDERSEKGHTEFDTVGIAQIYPSATVPSEVIAHDDPMWLAHLLAPDSPLEPYGSQPYAPNVHSRAPAFPMLVRTPCSGSLSCQRLSLLHLAQSPLYGHGQAYTLERNALPA